MVPATGEPKTRRNSVFITFLSVLMSVLVFSIFSFETKLTGLTRTILNSPKSIFETAIPLVTEDDEFDPYLLKEDVKTKYNAYLDSTVYKYVKDYDVEYYFYNIDNKGACDIRDCKGVEISFSSYINMFYTYHYKTYYEIKRNY